MKSRYLVRPLASLALLLAFSALSCSSSEEGSDGPGGPSSSVESGAGGGVGQVETGGSGATGSDFATGGATMSSGGVVSSGGVTTSSGGLASGGVSIGTGGGEVDTPPVDCSGISAAGFELCDSSADSCGAVFDDSSGCSQVCAAAGLSCVESWENLDGVCAADTSLPGISCDSGHQSDYCVCGGPVIGGSGGVSGTGGSDNTGGTTGVGGSPPLTGDLSIFDPVPGWAGVGADSHPDGTTGGGTDLSLAITVSSMSELQDAASGSSPAIILVQPGTYSGEFRPGANKTIIGTAPGVLIQGNMAISGSSVFNVIVRNIAVQGNPCSSYDDCRAGDDAVYVGNQAHHVWLDHLDIYDGQDGNCDITQEGDYVTVSWSQFHYTYDKEHRFSNLIAGSDSETNSRGKLQISYMNCWWGDRVNQRSPRGRFGKVHMVNNYHSSKDTSYVAGPGVEAQFLVENCFYEINSGRPAFSSYDDSAAWRGVGNEGNAEGMNSSQGSVFTPPYSYDIIPASQVKAAVTSTDCGAGNSCDFEM